MQLLNPYLRLVKKYAPATTAISIAIAVAAQCMVVFAAVNSYKTYDHLPGLWSQSIQTVQGKSYSILRRPLRFGSLYAILPTSIMTNRHEHERASAKLQEQYIPDDATFFHSKGNSGLAGSFVSKIPTCQSRGVAKHVSDYLAPDRQYVEVLAIGAPFYFARLGGYTTLDDSFFGRNFVTIGEYKDQVLSTRSNAHPKFLLGKIPLNVDWMALALNISVIVIALWIVYCLIIASVYFNRTRLCRCVLCNYDLRGIKRDRCPECGAATRQRAVAG